AKRFAAKEAFAKAVGTGLRAPVSLSGIRVGHDDLGRPDFRCAPELDAWLAERQIGRVHLSISDEHEHVVAFAVAET
ncbi:MAG: 4'-phosphopantetheinyl transferase superfamily protein, partial [Gallionellaceae bacterium]|nr:4'-phosphopantetheinyl transferase superfamily protein [Gallionellaceae bacterium]